jgi:glycosyltransferase
MSNQTIKISLITVTWQSAATLAETIQSVRRQNCDDLEYIVVDGGSTDGTLELLKQNEDVVTHWISEPDKGIYDAMNKGLGLAKGEVVGFLNADDFLASSHILADIRNHFTRFSPDLIYGDLEYVSLTQPQHVVRYWQSKPFRHSLLKRGWMPPHPTVYVKRDFFHRVGFFDLNYRISADYDWLLRAFSQPKTRCDYLPKVLVKMRLGGVSNRSLRGLMIKSSEDYKALRSSGVGGLSTLFLKNASKLSQFVLRN